MTGPQRVRVTGDLYHPQVPEGAVYVGRSGPGISGSKFANPFSLKRKIWRHQPLRRYLAAALIQVTCLTADDLQRPVYDMIVPGTATVAVTAYRLWLADRPALVAAAREELAGWDLACWCKTPPCHVDVLLEVSNTDA